MFETKRCSKCKENKLLSEFSKHRKQVDGLSCWCKACTKQNYLEHAEERKAQSRQWAKDNPERNLARTMRTYYKRRGQEVPDKWKDDFVPDTRTQVEVHQDHLAQRREYRREHIDEINRKKKEYAMSDAGRLANTLTQERRRFWQMMCKSNLRVEDIQFLKVLQGNKCACCGIEFTNGVTYTIDHIIPLSLGGWLTLENAQLLCKKCNSSKGNAIIRFAPTIESYYSEVT